MRKKEPQQQQQEFQFEKQRERVETVLQILRKQTPLTLKQEKFCNDACIERFLKWKGDNVKKAAKHLRACLSWRDAIGIEHVMADEFSSELAEGVAYVAGHDDEARPVLVFRMKQDSYKFHSQKSFVRLVAFTLEVAVASMSRFVEQLVILFDGSFFKSASAFLNLFMGILKLISEYYPGRLHKAFVVDPPSLFSYLWKGARPFVDLWSSTSLVFSLDFEDTFDDDPFSFSSYPRTASLRFEPAAAAAAAASVMTNPAKSGVGSASSRFAFTVSHLDSLKPWYLSRTESGPQTSSPSLVGVSPLNARSFSFATPTTTRGCSRSTGISSSRSIPSTPAAPGKGGATSVSLLQPRTPRPSFLQSPSVMFWRRGGAGDRTPAATTEPKGKEAFVMYLRFYRKPYDEMVYRSKMRPPLGGIVSIVSPHMIRQQRCRHVSHQRF